VRRQKELKKEIFESLPKTIRTRYIKTPSRLEVHQVELEMQNDELMNARDEVQNSQ